MKARVFAVIAVSVSLARAASAADPSPPPDDAAPLPSRDTRWYAVAGGSLDTGTMPDPSLGATLGLDVRRGALGAKVVSSAFLATADAPGPSVALFDLVASGCAFAPFGGGAWAGLCAGGGIGLLRAKPELREPTLFARPEILASLRADLPLARSILLSLDGGALFDPVRPVLDASGYRPPAVALRTSLALYVRFF